LTRQAVYHRAPGKTTVRLSEIQKFSTIAAHMPDGDECARLGLFPGVAVLTMRTPDGQEELFFCDSEITLAIDIDTAPFDPGELRQRTREIVHQISEDLGNSLGDLGELAEALADSPVRVADLAGQWRQRRDAEWAAHDAAEASDRAEADDSG